MGVIAITMVMAIAATTAAAATAAVAAVAMNSGHSSYLQRVLVHGVAILGPLVGSTSVSGFQKSD